MNETNGPGAVPPSPQPVPGSDAERDDNDEDVAWAGGAVARAYQERDEALRQLAEARAEVEALREEVALTNEHEHQILQERNEARDLAFQRSHQIQDLRADLAEARAALLAYQEALRSAVSEARPALWCYPSGVLEYACPFCGEGTMRKRDDPQPQTVADIKHRDGCFVLVARPAPADVVTVPREEWEALRALFAAAGRAIHAASTGERATLEEINDAWAGVCSAQVALRSSAQCPEGGAP